MSDGLAFGDIIIFGAIAAFILLRYRSMLGEKTGRDPEEAARERKRAQAMAEVERVIQLPQRDQTVQPQPKASHEGYSETLRTTLNAAQKIDADFAADEFLEGANSAFEMVIEAYSKRDHDTLKMLLSKPLYTQFADALAADEKAGRKTENTLVSILKSEITDAQLLGNKATLTVAFTSDQIQLVRDASGTIIEGSASEEIEVEDVWVFTRDLTSSSPNWTIIET